MIVGVDPSSKKVALCSRGAGGEPLLSAVALGATKSASYDPTNAGRAFTAVGDFLRQNYMLGKRNFAFIESPVVGMGGVRSTLVQSFVSGALQAAFCEWEFVVDITNNKGWKKAYVGNGNCSKEDIAKKVKQDWPEAYRIADGDQDLLDAIGIFRYGESVLRRSR